MEKIKGYIDHIIYRNAENGYTVMELIVDGEEVTCVGIFQTITQGENIEAEGEFVEHPVYGEQFKTQHYKIVEPDDVVSMERYLASGAVKGICPWLPVLFGSLEKRPSVSWRRSRRGWQKSKESAKQRPGR